MNNSFADRYREAGVDITAGYRAVELMKAHVARTMIPGCVEGVGGFGGLFELDLTGIERPMLVAGTDGVGTKLKIAFLLDRHDTVGIDCVAMCVNDVVACGAKPLFFLDYIACGKNLPERVAQIVAGVAEGCVQAGCALIGGETAEMPGFYPEDEYDLAGFTVGVVDKARRFDKSTAQAGDVLLALPSSGVHSNGFSLVRKLLRIDSGACDPEILRMLLTPTRIYVKPLLALAERVCVKSAAHITGGGFYENIPRSLPAGLEAVVDRAALRVPEIFRVLQRAGDMPERELFNTFNMGVGMTVVVARADVDRALAALRGAGEDAYVLGALRPGDAGVVIA